MRFGEQRSRFNENKTESHEMENLTHSFREIRALGFSLYKNRKLKVKVWLVKARERKKRISFTVYFVQRETF